MAASLLGGAAVGAAFGELLKAVLEMKDKAIMFKPTLAYLRTTLIAIDPVIKEIQQHNSELGRPKEELELLIRDMEEGTKLVYKCSKIHKYNFPARIRYQEQLVALVESLVRFFMIDMQAQTARDLKETLLKVRRIHSAVNKMHLDRTEDKTGSASESDSATVDQIDVHDGSAAMQPNDENAMETGSNEEAIESEALRSTSTPPAEDEDGIDSAELVMEDITSSLSNAVSQIEEETKNGQGSKHLMSVKSYDQPFSDEKRENFMGICLPKIAPILHKIGGFNPVEPSTVNCTSCGTIIKQNIMLYIKGPARTIYCNQCFPREIIAFEGCPYKFGLKDLLNASSTEVLRESNYGTTYKVILKNGTESVMKRLNNVVVEKKEFEQQMEIVQRVCQHPNVMPLLACYYSIDEKLLIYDYMAEGSFYKLLHGTRKYRTDLDSRVKVSLGVAKGIAHIHSMEGGKLVHGNISSSNVLVTNDHQGCITDLSITYSVSNSFDRFEKSGYQAPEVDKTSKMTQECDVYSFGILLLEMLTGKLPLVYDDLIDYPLSAWNWFYVVNGGLANGDFDGAIRDKSYAKNIMKLAHECVAKIPYYRPSMKEVVAKMETIVSQNGKKKKKSILIQ